LQLAHRRRAQNDQVHREAQAAGMCRRRAGQAAGQQAQPAAGRPQNPVAQEVVEHNNTTQF
jgi:hypothetical protein